ncbi:MULTISPECIES: ABC transporter ATP-binding protein [Cryobacterium]|uniref:ABC transporter n=1 Tax=Cryobacterium zongtaii TaxID=1259217 RepID=A0A2S3ZF75_9MICO|nr:MULTISPECIES: ABC transporter ATP-binding protein [Cryobacterium]POH65290.1 ABC transporter [Cryobacterium zongtaii]POH70657.1 ABC transporter [Cryobacterium zongtaii]TFC41922.1 ABC transporter ATP-binding protein [Cryobacterium sp. TMN-39-2]TFC51917.1 ABC transporter ATP-binding protein [Cryobacterium sp. TMB3-1-2]TFC57950.1 ABC transporter ATP-binding protein [Cryobacterium sp. TMB1-7]
MTTSPPAVRVSRLSKSYGAFDAVNDISFDIRPGETFALLGPNGAGKSSTIEILEGYRDRSEGDVTVLGVDPQHAGLDWKARIGIVLQSSGESGNATVLEQLRHFASLYPNPRPVEEVLAAVGLEEKAKTRIHRLSGGQQRRVDVALGIIGRPELLFLDEPTTGFDPEARHQFWDLIRTLKGEGTTILLTTHNLDEAAELSDRAGIIVGGRLIDIGTIGELGGPAARIPMVRWRDADGVQREARTETPAGLVAQLARDLGGEPAELQVIRPSLEDIYLGLVRGHAAGSTSDTASTEVLA